MKYFVIRLMTNTGKVILAETKAANLTEAIGKVLRKHPNAMLVLGEA